MSTCTECRYKNGAHTAWCSKNKNHPTPPPSKYDNRWRNFKKRPDDGRSKKRPKKDEK